MFHSVTSPPLSPQSPPLFFSVTLTFQENISALSCSTLCRLCTILLRTQQLNWACRSFIVCSPATRDKRSCFSCSSPFPNKQPLTGMFWGFSLVYFQQTLQKAALTFNLLSWPCKERFPIPFLLQVRMCAQTAVYQITSKPRQICKNIHLKDPHTKICVCFRTTPGT